MASLFAFRALRPAPEVAGRVAAVPYDVVNREEAAALAAGNPLSFLHVSRAEIDLAPTTDPYAPEVYDTALRNLESLKRDAPMLIEDTPSVYLYRLRMGSHEQTGVAACCSLDEYDSDIIKKHEKTRPEKEDDRTRHMLTLRAQTGPVFLTYPASAAVDAIAASLAVTPPLYDIAAPDGVQHTMWRADEASAAGLVEAFRQIPALYIADGHHRAASAARARQQLRSVGPASLPDNPASRVAESGTMLAVAFPHDQVQVLPYNRVVRDLAGRSAAALLADVSARFPVTAGVPSPSAKGGVSMYLDRAWHRIDLTDAASKASDRIGGLDVSVLQDAILAPLLGIADPRVDKRIDFVGGSRGAAELERLVDSGAYAVAFSLYPVTVADLMAISDAGGIMPPKSTWFEPKLRDGLLSHLI